MSGEVLFCIDMQDYYRPFMGDWAAACRTINALSAAAAKINIPTWMVYYDSGNAFPGLILNADTPDEFRRECLAKFDSSATGGLGDVVLTAHTPVVFKQESNAFKNKNLADALRRQGIKKIYLTGFATGACVAASAVGAALNGFEVSIIEDACYYKSGRPGLPMKEEEIHRCLVNHFLDEIKLPPANGMPKTAGPGANLREISMALNARIAFAEAERVAAFRTMMESNHPDYLALQNIRIMAAAQLLENRPELAQADPRPMPQSSLYAVQQPR